MSLFAKIMVVVNFILAVAFLAAAGTLLGATENWKEKYDKLTQDRATEIAALEAQIRARQDELARLNEQIRSAVERSAGSEARLRDLQESNTTLQARNQELQQSIEKLATAQTDLQNQNAQLGQQIDTLRSQLSTADAERKQAQEQARTLQENLAREEQAREAAEKSLSAQETAYRGLQEEFDSTRTNLELYKKQFPGGVGTIVMKDVEGVVQAADNRWDVFVISVGANEGVEVGYEFTVFRGNDYIATIVVDEVYPRYSSGRVKKGYKRGEIQPGDRVDTRL